MKEDKDKKINYDDLNSAIKLSGKILKIIYVLIIVVIVFAATRISKEWGVISFVLNLLKVLSPLFIGIVIAWILDPLIMWFEKRKIGRMWSSIIVYALILAVIVFAFTSFIPVMLSQINDLARSIPGIIDDFGKWINNLFVGMASNEYIDFDAAKADLFLSIQDLAKGLTTTLPDKILGLINGLFSALGTFILGLIMGFYLLYDYDKVKAKMNSLIPKKYETEYKELGRDINASLFGFVKGMFFSSTIVFVCAAIVLSIIGLKAPLLFALIAAILNVIPYVGPYLGIIPPAIVGFSQNSATGVLVIIVLGIIQLIEGNIINPLIMSKTMKLSPITILISILVFGYLFGMLGVLIAAPLAAVVKVIYQFIMHKLNRKGLFV